MLDVFRGLKGLIKISHVTIDSTIFRMNYSVTVSFLIAFSLIVTTRQYVGNPIDCIHTKEIPEDVLNTYCWIHSTYTIPSAFWKRIGIDVAHPGVDKTIDPEERRYVKYYQWVCFCLFFQVSPLPTARRHEVMSSYVSRVAGGLDGFVLLPFVPPFLLVSQIALTATKKERKGTEIREKGQAVIIIANGATDARQRNK